VFFLKVSPVCYEFRYASELLQGDVFVVDLFRVAVDFQVKITSGERSVLGNNAKVCDVFRLFLGFTFLKYIDLYLTS